MMHSLSRHLAFTRSGPFLPGSSHALGLACTLALGVPAAGAVNGASLTTNQMGAPTSIQNVKPRFDQRGTEIDGTVRSGSAMGLQLGANPFGEAWNRNAVLGDGVRVPTGTYAPFEIDLSFPAEVPWVVGRTFNARQNSSGHHDSNGYQGRNWFQTSQPEMVYVNTTIDLLYMVYGADRFTEYAAQDADEYTGTNGAGGVIQAVAGAGSEPDTYVLHDPSGIEVTFFAEDYLDTVPHPDVLYEVEGQIWRIEDQAGNRAYVGHPTTASAAAISGYEPDGRIKVAYDSAGRRFTYTYTTLDSVNRLTKVLAEIDDGDVTWEAAGLQEIEVGRVEYDYYGTVAGVGHGGTGCLMLARSVLPLSITADSATVANAEAECEVRESYYRYWKGAYDGTNNRGHEYALHYVVDAEGTRKYDWSDTTFDEDYLSASEGSLKPYAAASFEYDSSHRIDKVWFNGECGCAGGGANGVHVLAYVDAGSYATEVANSTYSASWMQRTVVNRPDTGWVSQYFDETGQPLTRALTDGDPSGSPSATWVHGAARNSVGQLEVLYSPASNTAYTHSTGATTFSTSVGLVTYYDYEGGAWIDEVNWSTGYKSTVTDRSRVEERRYSTLSETIGSYAVTRPAVDFRYVHPTVVATSTDPLDDLDDAFSGELALTGDTDQAAGAALAPRDMTTVLPVVTAGQNGLDAANSTATHMRADRTVAFRKDEGGHYDYMRYADGLLVERIVDADLTGTFAAGADDPNGTYGITETGGGLNLATTYAYDRRGRLTLTTLPSTRVTRSFYTRLEDGRLVVLSTPKYVDTTTDVFYGPASYTVANLAGKVEATGVIAFSGGSTTSDISTWVDEADDNIITAVDVGTLSRLSENLYDEGGTHLESSRAYTNVGSPAYDTTTYADDELGRRIRTVDPTGTIMRATYDVRGNVTATAIGTDDTGLPGSALAGSSNVVTTEARVYDGGSGGGNNYLTGVTRYVQDSSTDQRVTSFINDTRGRVIVATNPQSPHSVFAYDERGRMTATASYSTTSGLTASAVPTTTTNRLSYATTSYDALNRPYDARNYRITAGAIDQESTDVCLQTQTWYDAEGRVIKTVAGIIQKTEFDRLGRAVRQFTLSEIVDSTYADADDVSGDVVVEESRTIYQDSTGLALATGVIQRNYDQTGTGALDSNADTDNLKWTSANITGRIQITSMWHDSLDRLTTTAVYGTNHASNNSADFDRDGLSAPSRSATVLVTTNVYNDNGTLLSVTDPKDLETRYVYDAAHRQTGVYSNYDDGMPSGDTDNRVSYAYTDGLSTQMWVDFDADGAVDGGTDQVTTYDYGVTRGSDPDLSLIDVNNLLYSTAYPDSASGSDKVFHSYNAQGERIRTEDQVGDALVYTYDTGGRQTIAAATLAGGSPTDSAILRIETAYTSKGQVDTVSSYDAASSGTMVNQVDYSYDSWGNVTKIDQDRDAAGSGTSAYDVEFSYDEFGGSGTNFTRIHRTVVTYPGGQELEFGMGTNGTLGTESRVNFALGRVESVLIEPSGGGGAVQQAGYRYLGMGHVVDTTLTLVNRDMWSRVSSTSSAYPGLDRFNRIIESSWTWDYSAGTDYNAYEVDLAYDENSNITWAYDRWNGATDVKYILDNLNRLTSAQRGDESAGSITLENFHQEWTLDQPGNWDLFKNDLNGDGDWADSNELNDDRTHNLVNELTDRDTDDNGTDNFTTLGYTAAGQLSNDKEHYKYVYDAWGRLVKITNLSNTTVTEYEYNGLGHRIGHKWDTDGNASLEWQWLVYDDTWRVIARFDNGAAASNPFEQVYHHHAGLAGYGGSSYIDLVLCRDRDTDADPSNGREARDYVLQNWRADVIALANNDGDLLERVSYDPYGIPFATHPTDLTHGATGGIAGYGAPNGVLDNEDVFYYFTLQSGSNFRADWERDGDIDVDDYTAFSTEKGAATGSWGRGVLSNIKNRSGYAGYVHEPATGSAGGGHGTMWHVRNRVLHAGLGRWIQTDPLDYVDGSNLHSYGMSNPIMVLDPSGTICWCASFLGAEIKIDCSCVGKLRIWLIPEDKSKPAFTSVTCGETYVIDGYQIGGTEYKISNGGCLILQCIGNILITHSCCNSWTTGPGVVCPPARVPPGTFANSPPPGSGPGRTVRRPAPPSWQYPPWFW